jgi:23S rRNA pseudouridine1911/1915/1917 synthase
MTDRKQRGREWQIAAGEAGTRLDVFLAGEARAGSRGRATRALTRGQVFLNEREATTGDAGQRLSLGDRVRLWLDRPGSATRRVSVRSVGPLEILYEDTALLVINKPAGLLSVPLPRKADEPAVTDYLERHLRSRGKQHPQVVHRIDRDTSGLLVVARTGAAAAALKAQFEAREAERVYEAVVYGHPTPESGTWRDRVAWDGRLMVQKAVSARDPRGSEAVSRYKVLERFAGSALIEVRLVTGKRNQIRLQAQLRGHPLVGEQRYTTVADGREEIPFSRQALHAWKLGFRHPTDGRALSFEAPLPEDLRRLLRKLRRTTVALSRSTLG